jgi:urease accessory protein
MDGKVPETFVEGLLSGFGHPVIEVPHLAAILLVGAVAARTGGLALIAAFVAGSFLGTSVLGLNFPLPWGETLVFASGAVLAALLLMRSAMIVVTALVLATGIIHGMAFAEAIVGAETSPLIAYLIGLALTELVLATLVFVIAGRWSVGLVRRS